MTKSITMVEIEILEKKADLGDIQAQNELKKLAKENGFNSYNEWLQNLFAPLLKPEVLEAFEKVFRIEEKQKRRESTPGAMQVWGYLEKMSKSDQAIHRALAEYIKSHPIEDMYKIAESFQEWSLYTPLLSATDVMAQVGAAKDEMIQENTVRSVLETEKKVIALGSILYKAAKDVVAMSLGGVMPDINSLSPSQKNSRIIMGYTLGLLTAQGDKDKLEAQRESFKSGLFDPIIPQMAENFLMIFPTRESAVQRFSRPISFDFHSADTKEVVEQILNLTVEEANILVKAKPLVIEFKEKLSSQSTVRAVSAVKAKKPNAQINQRAMIWRSLIGWMKLQQVTPTPKECIAELQRTKAYKNKKISTKRMQTILNEGFAGAYEDILKNV